MAASNSHQLPLVFIHAFPLHGGMWEPQRQGLSDLAGIVALDLPGFGNEARLDSETFTMKLAARFVQHELEAKGIDQCVLAGLSMGGYVSFECWKLFPEKIRGLVLADTRAGADTDEGKKKRYEQAEQIGRGEFDRFAEALLEKLLSEKTRNERTDLVDAVRRLMHSSLPESSIAALLGMAQRADSTDLLPTISVPTAVIVGEHDAITAVEESRKMVDAIPDATLTVISNAGHLSNLENPVEFNAAVRELLERVGVEAGSEV
jgi:pimeloyl-ACP methyl ester carboxylesterase